MLPRLSSFIRNVSQRGLFLGQSIRPLAVSANDFDPCEYTSGRWLRADKQQREARHVHFDFDKLCAMVVACSLGARTITNCSKVEGGFNRAFIFQLDNDKSVVARVPFAVAGPSRLTTNSEVATMEYIRKNTSIPVPAILEWSDDPQSSVGTEYIIEEHARGVQLHQRWDSMNTPEQLQAVQALGRFAQEMSKLRFPAFGSIYFADAPVEQSHLIPIGDDFCIGPNCGTRYWPCRPGDERTYRDRPANRGPWRTHEEYCQGLVDVGFSRIPLATPPNLLKYRGTVEEHRHLNGVAQQVLLHLSQTDILRQVARPSLLHHDMHKRNIFVSDQNPGQITAIIDWQSSSIEPIHHYSDETPDLCEFPDGWDASALPEDLSKEQQKIANGVSICRRAWEAIVRGWLPEIYLARAMDQDFLRLFRYTSSAWRHGAVPLREDLMQLSSHWSQPLGLEGTCPYEASSADISRHQVLWKEFKLVHDVKDEVVRGLGTDEEGWVPVDRWEDTKNTHSLLFHAWLKDIVDSRELIEDTARMVWPFDAPP